MEKRARMENLRVCQGHVFITNAKVDLDFPGCPICSPATTIPSAIRTIKKLIVRAAMRDGATHQQGIDLVAFAAGGHVTYLTQELQRLKLRYAWGRRQRIPTERIVRGLNRLIWRVLGAVPLHGHGEPIVTDRTVSCILAAYTSIGARPSNRDLSIRSNRGGRDAGAAIRWLGSSASVADFVRRLYSACREHIAEVDRDWCSWSSERDGLVGGV